MRALPARFSPQDTRQKTVVAAFPASITRHAGEEARSSSPGPRGKALIIALLASIAKHGSGGASLSSPGRQGKAAVVGLLASIAKPGGVGASFFSSIAERRDTRREAFFLAIARPGLAFENDCFAAEVRELAAASIFARIYAARACACRLVLGVASSLPCLPTNSSLRAERGALRLKHRALPARDLDSRGAQPAGGAGFLALRVKRPAMISFNASRPAPLANTLASA